MDERDHRASGLVHDLLDQVERMLGALAEADEGDVRPLARRHRSHVLHLDLAGDHFVPERGDDRRDEGQAILALVGDQNAQMLGLAVAHLSVPGECTPLRADRSCRRTGRPFPLPSLLARNSSGDARPAACFRQRPRRRVLALTSSRPDPQADSFFRLRHLAGVARDRSCRAEPASQGAAYVPLAEPLDRFIPLHGREEKQ